ncbi:tail fiber domain-containing protein [Bdellovibrio bacteriovorus]|uniref:tail fiber domain-containing protein n=1 Tax=Bdellovibrio bacteriovorus TaxID=959 RepID=UPI0035A94F1C
MLEKNVRGFSLVEVMVTTAIMSVIGLAFAGFITDLFKQYRGMDAKSQLVDVVNQIRTELSSESACLASLGGQNPTIGFNVTQLKDRNGANTATQVPRDYGGVYRNLFSLTGMRVQDFDDSISGVGDRIGSSSLLLTFTINSSGGAAGTTTLVRPIRLHTEVNAAGGIVRCLALAGMTDGIWQKMSSNSQHIFYSAGNVGIGNTSPASLFNVGLGAQGINMGMNPAGGSDQLTIANSSGSSYLYMFSTASTSSSIGAFGGGGPRPLGLNPAGGNVGIGTNNPAGALHVASGPIIMQGNDSIVNTNAGTTTIGSGARWLNFNYNHNSGFASIMGTGPSGGQVGLPAGAALTNGAGLLVMNPANSATTQISQDGGGFRAISSGGTMTFESPGNISFESTQGNYSIVARGGQLQIGNLNFRTSARVVAGTPNVLTLQRFGNGNLNSTIQYLNGSNQTIYAGMATDETFGIGPNPNLLSTDTWFEINRSRGAQIRSFDPSVLTLTRTATGLNTAIRYTNGNFRIYMGMATNGDFAVKSADENLSASPWLRYERDTSVLGVLGSVRATAFVQSSDQRLKTHIKPLENSLMTILKIKGVHYEWKDKSLGKDIGVIAQNVQDVFPTAVVTDRNTGFLSVKYTALIAPIIEAIRDLFHRNEKQDLEIEALRRETQELRTEILSLKNQNKKIEN